MLGNAVLHRPTNPETREFVWQKAMENYRSHGVDLFWLDEAEPEYTVQDFDLYRYMMVRH